MTMPRYGFECENCSQDFDPIACRWKCPHCGWKADCCNGAPLPPRRTVRDMRREGDQRAITMMRSLR